MLSNFGLKATDYLPLTGKSDDEPKHRKKQQLYWNLVLCTGKFEARISNFETNLEILIFKISK